MPFLTEKLSLTGLRRLVKQMRQAHQRVMGTELPQHAAQEILAQTLGHPHWHAAHQQAQTVTSPDSADRYEGMRALATQLRSEEQRSGGALDADWVKVAAWELRHHGDIQHLLCTPLSEVTRWAASGRVDRLETAWAQMESDVQWLKPIADQARRLWRAQGIVSHMKRAVLATALHWDQPAPIVWANRVWNLHEDQETVKAAILQAVHERHAHVMEALLPLATPDTLRRMRRQRGDGNTNSLVFPSLEGQNPNDYLPRLVTSSPLHAPVMALMHWPDALWGRLSHAGVYGEEVPLSNQDRLQSFPDPALFEALEKACAAGDRSAARPHLQALDAFVKERWGFASSTNPGDWESYRQLTISDQAQSRPLRRWMVLLDHRLLPAWRAAIEADNAELMAEVVPRLHPKHLMGWGAWAALGDRRRSLAVIQAHAEHHWKPYRDTQPHEYTDHREILRAAVASGQASEVCFWANRWQQLYLHLPQVPSPPPPTEALPTLRIEPIPRRRQP
jgi:hypothetical protein